MGNKTKTKTMKGFYIRAVLALLGTALGIWILFCVLGHFGVVSIPAVDHFLGVFGWDYQVKLDNQAKKEDTEKDTENKKNDDKKDDTETESEEDTELVPGSLEDYQVSPGTAEDYFSGLADIKGSFEVSSSTSVQNENELYEDIDARGFTDVIMYYNYDMYGEFNWREEVDADSYTQHPMYEGYFLASSGDYWYVFSVNGSLYVSSLTYNEDSDVPVYFSESDTMYSYDASSNKFYEVAPNNTSMVLVKLAKIDRETLNKLTIEEIKKLL